MLKGFTPFIVLFNEANLPVQYKKCLMELRKHYPDLLIIRKVPEWFSATGDLRYDSDVARFDQLSKPGKWIYHDIDIQILNDFGPTDLSKPWFSNVGGDPEIYTIISQDPSLAQMLIDGMKNFTKVNIGYFQKRLMDNRFMYHLIPNGYYKHLALSTLQSNNIPKEPAL